MIPFHPRAGAAVAAATLWPQDLCIHNAWSRWYRHLPSTLLRVASGTLMVMLVISAQAQTENDDDNDSTIGSPSTAIIPEGIPNTDGDSGRDPADNSVGQNSRGRQPFGQTGDRAGRSAPNNSGASPGRFNLPSQGSRNSAFRRNRENFRGGSGRDGNSRLNRGSDSSGEPRDGNAMTNVPGFARYKIILDRNIFDSTRSPRLTRTREARRPVRTETVTLVGTLISEKGSYAFFDGSSAEFRKVLTMGKSISGYSIKQIASDHIALKSGTNTVELFVGGQMRREGDQWTIDSGNFRAAVSTANLNEPTIESTNDGEGDIVKRMMLQRENELK